MSGYGIKIKLTDADYKAAKRANSPGRIVELPACENPTRRRRLEKTPDRWLKWYLSETYTRPFEKPHREIIRGAVEASETSGRFVVAAERSLGKSSLLWGLVLYFKLTGRQPFPVCVPWADAALKRAFRFWKMALCFNDRLFADYPEYTAPFRAAKGVPQRVAMTTWKETGEPTGAQLTVGSGIIVFPDGRGCIGGSTVNGNIRGLNHTEKSGTVLRPSLALIDDVQDRKVAKSQKQIGDTVALIDGDIGGAGQAGRELPMMMACNCIAPHDVSEHYLTHTEWKSLRVPCVEHWPEGWEDPNSECRRLWDTWHDLFLSGKGDLKFYREHKAVMTRGMVLSAPAAFKGAEKCPDPFYGVMRMYFRMGHEAFMAERQQQPVDPVKEAGPYNLTPDVIKSRAAKGRTAMTRPEWATVVLASTDINPSYAMSTAVAGYGRDQSCAVLWYGVHRMAVHGQQPTPEFNKAVFAHLVEHGRKLAQLPVKPELWAIDGGGTNFDSVQAFVAESARLCGIQAFAFTGRDAKKYKPYGKTVIGLPREQSHYCADVKEGRRIRWVVWNSDYWREVAQKAWLGEIGSPGACSLFDGVHDEFAAQICNERLLGKGDVGGMTLWNWIMLPGRHDFGDAMAQAYAAAAACVGIGTGGQQRRRRYVETRKAKVMAE